MSVMQQVQLGCDVLLVLSLLFLALKLAKQMGIDDFQRVLERVGFEVEAVSPLHFWPVRWALAYIPWPGWITAPGFRIGQALMKLLGNHPKLGDYKAVKAVKPLSTEL